MKRLKLERKASYKLDFPSSRSNTSLKPNSCRVGKAMTVLMCAGYIVFLLSHCYGSEPRLTVPKIF